MKKKKYLLILFIAVLIGGILLYRNITARPQSTVTKPITFSGTSYVPVDSKQFDVQIFSDKVTSPTRIKVTPDGKYLLVAELSGEIRAFNRQGADWDKNPYKVTTVETNFPGFPPEEAGLVGMVFSVDFSENGKLFLLYSFKNQENKIVNRISETTLSTANGKLVGTTPQQIFEASTTGGYSHQITDGVGVKVLGKPHLLFAIGEAFGSKGSQDPAQEVGKIMLIQEDGSNPLGERPYPQDPKIQGIGVRNAYVVTQNPFTDPTQGMFVIADTGQDKFDRIIDIRLYSPTGAAMKPINLEWNGVDSDLQKVIPDPNIKGVRDTVVLRLPNTLTFTGFSFHSGKGAIPESTSKAQSVLITVFGKNSSKENTPGKEIWLGRLSIKNGSPVLTITPIVKRNPDATGNYGNPIGMEVDPQSGNFFFADIVENRVYEVKVK